MPVEKKSESGGPVEFSPAWGSQAFRLWQLIAAARAGEIQETVDQILCEVSECRTDEDAAVALSLSLLKDVLQAGGSAWVRDSRLFVSWPDWNGENGREAAQRAMSAAKDLRPLTREEIDRVRPLFARDLDGSALSLALQEGTFVLQSANSLHPTGVSYQEAFAAALRHWSMPYRGRSGRMKRFVLTVRHEVIGPHPVVAGILELGDEAPFCSWRDDLLGLSNQSFANWLTQPGMRDRAASIAQRLRAIRRVLRSTSSGWNLANSTAADIVARQTEIEQASLGRSLVLANQHELLKDQKRLAYGLRLARGELALSRLATGAPLEGLERHLFAGVRAVHDLILPRVHMEATVCGAVPPFSSALGGKLLVSFLSHPDVVASTMAAESELIGWSFDSERLWALLPALGMLCITTKGLYSNHAAIYNRSELPGRDKPLRLRHLANTDGITTSLISDKTTRYARLLLENPNSNKARVSSVYGSGGAKRHRAIHAAVVKVGLAPRLAFAGIKRPVYGTEFVSNAASVCWLGEEPDWLIRREEGSDSFTERAVGSWRQRWLERASIRVTEYALLPSLVRILEASSRMRKEEENQS